MPTRRPTCDGRLSASKRSSRRPRPPLRPSVQAFRNRRGLAAVFGGRVGDLAQARQAAVALADEALDRVDDVSWAEVRLVDDLLDGPAGPPSVVPIGRQRIVARDGT